MAEDIPVNKLAIIFDLKSANAQKHNGKLGRIMGPGNTPPRYAVRLTETGETLSVQPANVRVLPIDDASSNVFLVRPGPFDTPAELAELLQPTKLENFDKGEAAECAEIKQRFKWDPMEAGKFYDHNGSSDWYYFAYGPTSRKQVGQPKNTAAELVLFSNMRGMQGEFIVLKSGPVQWKPSAREQLISKLSLLETIWFYRTQSVDQVFAEREKQRFSNSMGFNLDGVPSMHFRI